MAFRQGNACKKDAVPIAHIAAFLFGSISVFMFLNPDMYLGIGDYYVIPCLYCILLLLKDPYIYLNKNTKSSMIFLIWQIIPVGIAVTCGGLSTGHMFSTVLYLIMLLFTMNSKWPDRSVELMCNTYTIGGFVTACIVLVQRELYYVDDIRYTIKFLSNDAFDPNFLGAFLVCPAVVSFAKWIRQFSIKWMLCSFVISAGILFTASRGAALSLMVGVAFLIYGWVKKNISYKNMIFVGIVIVFAILAVLVLIPEGNLSRVFDIKTYMDGSNSKRVSNWIAGMKAFQQRPLLGYGYQTEQRAIAESIGTNSISHNTYIAWLLQFGVLGSVIPVGMIFSLIYKIRNDYELLAMLLSTLFVIIFISAQTATFLWMPIIMIFALSQCPRSAATE